MAEINVNSKNVEQLVLKKQKEAEKAGNVNDGTGRNDKFTELVKRFCAGEYANFAAFCKDLVSNGVLKESIKTITLESSANGESENTALNFQTRDGKKYTFYVPTEYINGESKLAGLLGKNSNTSELGRGDVTTGAKGAQGVGGAKGTDDIKDVGSAIEEINMKFLQFKENCKHKGSMNLQELLQLVEDGAGIAENCELLLEHFANDLSLAQKVALQNTKAETNLRKAMVNALILTKYDTEHNWTEQEIEQNINEIAANMNELLEHIENEGIAEYINDINAIQELLEEYQGGNNLNGNMQELLDLIQMGLLQIQEYDAEGAFENIDELTFEQINTKLQEYSQISGSLGSFLGSIDVNNIAVSQINILGAYADTLEVYNKLMGALWEQLPPQQQEIINNTQEEFQGYINGATQLYAGFMDYILQDNSLSAQEIQMANNLETALRKLYPNLLLDTTIDLVTNGWGEGQLSTLEKVIEELSDAGQDKYHEFLNLNTSTYANKKKAVELIDEILNDPKWGQGLGHGMQEAWVRLGQLLNLRKEYLERQIENMEKRMVRINDIQFQNQHVDQTTFR